MQIERTLLAAQGYIELDMPEVALRELDELPPEDQARQEVQQVKLFIFMRARRWKDAMQVCDRLREADPEQTTGYIHGAFCLHELGKTREAVHWAMRYQAEQERKDGTRLLVGDFNEAGVPAQTSWQ